VRRAQDGTEVTEGAFGTDRRVMVAASVGTFIELYDSDDAQPARAGLLPARRGPRRCLGRSPRAAEYPEPAGPWLGLVTSPAS
jgi:hypothetical protein